MHRWFVEYGIQAVCACVGLSAHDVQPWRLIHQAPFYARFMLVSLQSTPLSAPSLNPVKYTRAWTYSSANKGTICALILRSFACGGRGLHTVNGSFLPCLGDLWEKLSRHFFLHSRVGGSCVPCIRQCGPYHPLLAPSSSVCSHPLPCDHRTEQPPLARYLSLQTFQSTHSHCRITVSSRSALHRFRTLSCAIVPRTRWVLKCFTKTE